MSDVKATQQIFKLYQVLESAHLWGKNGGGDRYYTDGELTIVVRQKATKQRCSATTVTQSACCRDENRVWSGYDYNGLVVDRTVFIAEAFSTWRVNNQTNLLRLV